MRLLGDVGWRVASHRSGTESENAGAGIMARQPPIRIEKRLYRILENERIGCGLIELCGSGGYWLRCGPEDTVYTRHDAEILVAIDSL